MRQMHLQNYLFSIIWHFVIVVVVAIVLWLFTIFITIWIFFPSPQFHSVNAAAATAVVVVVVVFRVRYYYYFCCCIVFSTFFLHHHRINIINGMHNKYACVHLIYWKRNRLKPKMSLIVNTYYNNHKITIEKRVAWKENAPNAFIHSLFLGHFGCIRIFSSKNIFWLRSGWKHKFILLMVNSLQQIFLNKWLSK